LEGLWDHSIHEVGVLHGGGEVLGGHGGLDEQGDEEVRPRIPSAMGTTTAMTNFETMIIFNSMMLLL